ncbi:MAG: hypothetical protein AAF996_05220 [Pseudomonadota bacterium]
MLKQIKSHCAKACLIAALGFSGMGAASAGSCISSVKYDGPSSKIFIYINNKSSTSFLAVLGRAKNTSDIRDENGSYKELDRNTVAPGEAYMFKEDTSSNANKVYSVHMLSTMNMFRIQNDAGLTTGTSRYQGKSDNMEYKTYNQNESNGLKISCDRDYTSAAKWKITFNVTDR